MDDDEMISPPPQPGVSTPVSPPPAGPGHTLTRKDVDLLTTILRRAPLRDLDEASEAFKALARLLGWVAFTKVPE